MGPRFAPPPGGGVGPAPPQRGGGGGPVGQKESRPGLVHPPSKRGGGAKGPSVVAPEEGSGHDWGVLEVFLGCLISGGAKSASLPPRLDAKPRGGAEH